MQNDSMVLIHTVQSFKVNGRKRACAPSHRALTTANNVTRALLTTHNTNVKSVGVCERGENINKQSAKSNYYRPE